MAAIHDKATARRTHSGQWHFDVCARVCVACIGLVCLYPMAIAGNVRQETLEKQLGVAICEASRLIIRQRNYNTGICREEKEGRMKRGMEVGGHGGMTGHRNDGQERLPIDCRRNVPRANLYQCPDMLTPPSLPTGHQGLAAASLGRLLRPPALAPLHRQSMCPHVCYCCRRCHCPPACQIHWHSSWTTSVSHCQQSTRCASQTSASEHHW